MSDRHLSKSTRPTKVGEEQKEKRKKKKGESAAFFVVLCVVCCVLCVVERTMRALFRTALILVVVGQGIDSIKVKWARKHASVPVSTDNGKEK